MRLDVDQSLKVGTCETLLLIGAGGRFTKGLGALFSVQSIPDFPPKWFSETVP